jgi:hypothetical protein
MLVRKVIVGLLCGASFPFAACSAADQPAFKAIEGTRATGGAVETGGSFVWPGSSGRACATLTGGVNGNGGAAGVSTEGDASVRADAAPLEASVSCPVDQCIRFQGACPSAGCPAGTICARQIGGVIHGGGEGCAPIPEACKATPTCACLARCVCGVTNSGDVQGCSDLPGDAGEACDNGIR